MPKDTASALVATNTPPPPEAPHTPPTQSRRVPSTTTSNDHSRTRPSYTNGPETTRAGGLSRQLTLEHISIASYGHRVSDSLTVRKAQLGLDALLTPKSKGKAKPKTQMMDQTTPKATPKPKAKPQANSKSRPKQTANPTLLTRRARSSSSGSSSPSSSARPQSPLGQSHSDSHDADSDGSVSSVHSVAPVPADTPLRFVSRGRDRKKKKGQSHKLVGTIRRDGGCCDSGDDDDAAVGGFSPMDNDRECRTPRARKLKGTMDRHATASGHAHTRGSYVEREGLNATPTQKLAATPKSTLRKQTRSQTKKEAMASESEPPLAASSTAHTTPLDPNVVRSVRRPPTLDRKATSQALHSKPPTTPPVQDPTSLFDTPTLNEIYKNLCSSVLIVGPDQTPGIIERLARAARKSELVVEADLEDDDDEWVEMVKRWMEAEGVYDMQRGVWTGFPEPDADGEELGLEERDVAKTREETREALVDLLYDINEELGDPDSRRVVDTHQARMDRWEPINGNRLGPNGGVYQPDVSVLSSWGRMVQPWVALKEGEEEDEEYKNGFERCVAVLEGKFELDDPVLIYRLGAYAQQCFVQQQNRKHVFTVAFSSRHAQLYLFDRCGVMQLHPIDMHEDPILLVRLLSLLVSADDTSSGFDESIFYELDERGRGTGRRFIRTFLDDSPSSAKDDFLLVYRTPVLVGQDIAGRGTTCWRAKHPKDRRDVFIKDYYKPSDEREDQSEVHLLPCAKGLLGVAQMVSSEERGRSIFGERRVSVEEDEAGVVGRAGETLDRASYDREWVRIVMECYGRSLSSFDDREAFLVAIRDAILGHERLLDVGVLHRDISPNNILFGKPNAKTGERGVLIDLDMAILVSSLTSQSPQIGTYPFRSHSILTNDLKVLSRYAHDHMDDLESFFYVLCWIVFRYVRPGVKRSPEAIPACLKLWDDERGREFVAGAAKLEFLLNEKEVGVVDNDGAEQEGGISIPAYWGPVFSKLVGELKALFRPVILAKMRREWPRVVDEEARRDQYRAFVDLLDEAIGSVRQERESLGVRLGVRVDGGVTLGESAEMMIPALSRRSTTALSTSTVADERYIETALLQSARTTAASLVSTTGESFYSFASTSLPIDPSESDLGLGYSPTGVTTREEHDVHLYIPTPCGSVYGGSGGPELPKKRGLKKESSFVDQLLEAGLGKDQVNGKGKTVPISMGTRRGSVVSVASSARSRGRSVSGSDLLSELGLQLNGLPSASLRSDGSGQFMELLPALSSVATTRTSISSSTKMEMTRSWTRSLTRTGSYGRIPGGGPEVEKRSTNSQGLFNLGRTVGLPPGVRYRGKTSANGSVTSGRSLSGVNGGGGRRKQSLRGLQKHESIDSIAEEEEPSEEESQKVGFKMSEGMDLDLGLLGPSPIGPHDLYSESGPCISSSTSTSAATSDSEESDLVPTATAGMTTTTTKKRSPLKRTRSKRALEEAEASASASGEDGEFGLAPGGEDDDDYGDGCRPCTKLRIM